MNKWLSWNSLRTRIALVLVGLTLTLGIVALFQAAVDLTAILGEQLQNRGIAIASDVAARSVVPSQTNDVFGLYDVVNTAFLSNPEVRYIFVIERSGDVRAHTFDEGVPAPLVEANPWDPTQPRTVRLLKTNEGPILDIAVPIMGGQGGVVHVGMSQVVVQRRVARYIGRLAVLLSIAILGAIGLSIAVSSLLTRPLVRVAEAARRVGAGDLSTKLPVNTGDELGDLARAFNKMTEDLVCSRESLLQRNAQLEILNKELEHKERLRGELLNKVISAQEEERKRIAREIHDEPAQRLSGVLMQLDKAVQRLAKQGSNGWHDVEQARLQVRGAIESLHHIISELRPQALDDLGFVPAIRWYAEQRLLNQGVEVDFQVLGKPVRLPPAIEIAAFRIAQEAISNVAKHAQASRVQIVLHFREDSIGGQIQDNGRGFDPAALAVRPTEGAGLGILGMQERAVLVGGSLSITSRLGQGTTVAFDIPLPERRSDHAEAH